MLNDLPKQNWDVNPELVTQEQVLFSLHQAASFLGRPEFQEHKLLKLAMALLLCTCSEQI